MKKLILVLITLILLVPMSVMAKGGFDEFGYNRQARIFNGFFGYYDKSIDGGWIEGTGDMWLTMKWSKDWVPMIDEPVGAWVTNHFTWYSNDIDENTFYGYDTRVEWTEEETPEAKYKIENFIKIMKVDDDAEAWAEYDAAGAYSAGWGTYGSGVPKYVVFQEVVEIYDVETDELFEEFNFIENVNKGLGKPIF